MGIELAIRADDAALGGGQLPTAMNNRTNRTQRPALGRCRPDDVYAELSGGVGPACRHHGVHSAANC